MIKLSKASKMPCKSWSLQALDTCPASRDMDTGELVPACAGCYATTGNYRFPNVKAPRISNKTDWQRDDWCNDMVSAIENDPYFRWFDSGDCYALKLAYKILEVMMRTPNTMHWLPSRMFKFAKFVPVFDAMNALPNVVVRFSSDSITGGIVESQFNSTIIESDEGGMNTCHAYLRDGKCGDCRTCWNKDVQTVTYPQHGRQMAKINIQLKAA